MSQAQGPNTLFFLVLFLFVVQIKQIQLIYHQLLKPLSCPSNKVRNNIYFNMCVYVHMCAPHVWGFPWRSEEGVDIRAPGTGETGGCELSVLEVGPNLGSPGKAINALNSWGVSPVPSRFYFLNVNSTQTWLLSMSDYPCSLAGVLQLSLVFAQLFLSCSDLKNISVQIYISSSVWDKGTGLIH